MARTSGWDNAATGNGQRPHPCRVPGSWFPLVPLSSRILFSVQETHRTSFDFNMLQTLPESRLQAEVGAQLQRARGAPDARTRWRPSPSGAETPETTSAWTRDSDEEGDRGIDRRRLEKRRASAARRVGCEGTDGSRGSVTPRARGRALLQSVGCTGRQPRCTGRDRTSLWLRPTAALFHYHPGSCSLCKKRIANHSSSLCCILCQSPALRRKSARSERGTPTRRATVG